jgi:hypothetical protein
MTIDGASDPVAWLAISHRQQPHDDVRPQREGAPLAHSITLRPSDRLRNDEPAWRLFGMAPHRKRRRLPATHLIDDAAGR